jgi:adenosylcobinamide kinase/adenosylcobinamide-phosphate guanylyltransferase
MGQLILILGGVRSGKSAYAQELAQHQGAHCVLFVATAEAGDAEMARRITAHRQSRPATWRTLEAPREVAKAIEDSLGDARVVLIDCLTLLVSNVILALGETPDPSQAEHAVQAEVQALWQTCQARPATFIVVSNEVGLGLVPDNPLGRLYRDLLGQANQVLAVHAQAVYWMVAGLAVELKAMQVRKMTD